MGDGYDKPDDFDTQRFSFNVTLSADEAATLQQDGTTDYYHGTISGGTGDGKKDDQQIVMKLHRDSESATSGKLLQCVADGDTDAEKCAETASITLSNRQTLSIANISDGVTYTIKETGLPNGYVFESAQSSNLTGTIQRSSGIAAAVVGNVYQPNNITLVAGRFVTVVKKVVGSATGSYPFEFQLQAAQGTPLPTCGTADTCSCLLYTSPSPRDS